MKLEVRTHEVRSSDELPGVPYFLFVIVKDNFTNALHSPTKCRILAHPFWFLAIVIPLLPEIANFSTKYHILNKVYTAEDGIPLLCPRPILI